MKIYTRLVIDIETGAIDSEESFEYNGKVALCCGATDAQNEAQAAQASAYKTMTQQASQVFGADSQVFNALQATFAPTVAAGPSQQGFSAAELSALKSQAITQSGNAYNNARQAVGESIAAQGGGNNAALQSGTNIGVDLGVANAAAANTSSELNQIDEANYATGRQNYKDAVAGLEGATGSFNSATSAGSAATNAGEASANTANQIATQNNSWVQAVSGALGGIAGGVVTGGMSNLGKGLSFFGNAATSAATGSNPTYGPDSDG